MVYQWHERILAQKTTMIWNSATVAQAASCAKINEFRRRMMRLTDAYIIYYGDTHSLTHAPATPMCTRIATLMAYTLRNAYTHIRTHTYTLVQTYARMCTYIHTPYTHVHAHAHAQTQEVFHKSTSGSNILKWRFCRSREAFLLDWPP